MASRKLREPSTAVYQFGRGSEPMIEVGRAIPADALYIVYSPVGVFWLCGGVRSEIVCIALRRDVPHQRTIGRRQRLAGIAEAVHDRIAPVAAKILQRHLDAGRRLPALVFGEVEHAFDLRHGFAVEAI